MKIYKKFMRSLVNSKSCRKFSIQYTDLDRLQWTHKRNDLEDNQELQDTKTSSDYV